MKNIILGLVVVLVAIPFSYAKASPAESRLRGRILLQVEKNGEAWYVKPDNGKRIYLKDGDAAYQIMRDEGLGITNNDLTKIPVGIYQGSVPYDGDNDGDGLTNKIEEALGTDMVNPDTDGDGFSDGTEVKNGYDPRGSGALKFDNDLVSRLKGKILLQVQNKGQAWYLNPVDGKRYYMNDGYVAYKVMRELSLGITNNDLAKIDIDQPSTETEDKNSPDFTFADQQKLFTHDGDFTGYNIYQWANKEILYTRYYEGELTQSLSKNYSIIIDSTIDSIVISTSWTSPNNDMKLTLIGPNGSVLSGDVAGVGHIKNSLAESYYIFGPAVGEWTAKIDTIKIVDQDDRFELVGEYYSDLIVSGWTKDHNVNIAIGEAIEIQALSGRESTEDIYQNNIFLEIADPNNTHQTFQMYDDGNHFDELPGDGIYGVRYYPTVPGAYQYYVIADWYMNGEHIQRSSYKKSFWYNTDY